MTAIAGQLVTEAFEYDDGRPVTVYIPPDSPQGIVFAGDGQLISQWGGLLEAADVPPTMIVGAHRLDDETLRLQEYSPGFEPRRFAAHEQFFVDEVRRWVRSRFGVAFACRTHRGVRCVGERRACARDGASTPGSLRCRLLRFAGWEYRPPAVLPSPVPRAYLVAGTLEPFFLENATRWATALRGAGAEVVMTERVGSHGDAFWREEFPLMVAWAFGQRGSVRDERRRRESNPR